ncbi:MAG: hypothetical protein R2941_02850 [Desulfobacterales bacterium]
MGHAGAIISGNSGTGQSRAASMKANGISVCENLAYLKDVCQETFAKVCPKRHPEFFKLRMSFFLRGYRA